MLIRCQGGHEWSVGMQSRKAKSWCRVCRDVYSSSKNSSKLSNSGTLSN
jgi:hypothetical protein